MGSNWPGSVSFRAVGSVTITNFLFSPTLKRVMFERSDERLL
jgi:hypothetical protein